VGGVGDEGDWGRIREIELGAVGVLELDKRWI
jgi:hypothetical protein